MESLCEPTSDGKWLRPNWYGNIVELVATLVQIIAAFVVLSLIVAKDEHPQAPLLIWVIGYTCACIATVPILFWRLHTYIRQDLSLSTPYIAPAADEENKRERIHRVIDYIKMPLECFFVAWFLGGLFFLDNSSQDHGSILLCQLILGFLVFSCFRYGIHLLHLLLFPLLLCGFLIMQVKVLVLAFYSCIIRSFDVDSELESDGEDISCCCICLGKYGDKDEQIRKLACLHVFHQECIEM